MANVIVALISVVATLAGALFLSQGALRSVDSMSEAWRQMENRSSEIAKTEFEVIATDHAAQTITIRNTGQTALRDFEAWDIVAQYTENGGAFHQVWLPYTASVPPGNNQWTVRGIYRDAGSSTPEVFQPGIFNPGEEMKLEMKLTPPPAASDPSVAVIGAPNGVSLSTIF